ncbi:SDR family oxidoreductase [Pseudomonas sp. 14P_8.1_Bac3]|uniref:SDR family oxidoreductase n=1 Tax=Pseudomonas sp. 14P_8.1_Bac3 TaxID=2971621 RepID=UPI0021C9C8B7|nr:SDR family oxidoreductase [Pseudomonas sp. 14P_8.1_Bac3]MCU1760929.1 SDR family oxidoreductase [Pseudomonas sp. 14P_8.1_Bac3]
MIATLSEPKPSQSRRDPLSAGPFLTDVAKAWPIEAREKFDNSLGRPGQPHEIVTAALYLASPFSSFVTGSLVRVDGGIP